MDDRVLVVDDDPAFGDLATRLLQEWGYEVIGRAGGVREALAQAEALRPDVVLADVALPDGDGFDLTDRLRSLPWPVAVVLVSADSGHRTAALRAGSCGFVPKDELSEPVLRSLLLGR